MAASFRAALGKMKNYPNGVRALLAINTAAVVWHSSTKMPCPVVYPKTTYNARLERVLVQDPRTEIRFRNVGTIPLILKSFHFERKGKKIDLDGIKDPLFQFSGKPI